MKKIKVAVVIPTHYDIHSSLQNLLKVYLYMIKKRHIVVTIFTDKKNNVDCPGFQVERIKGIDYKTMWEKVLFLLGIPRFWYIDLVEKLKGYDVIESSNPEFYGFACQAYKAAKRYNAKLIYRTSQTVEGFFLFKWTKYLTISFVRKAYRYAAFLLFTNPQSQVRCIRLGLDKNKRKHRVIGHPTDTKMFRPKNIKKSKKTILLSVGGLYKIKGHHLIIKSLKRICDKGYKNIELWIVGKGYYKDALVRLARRLGLEDKVKFLGSKGHEELAKVYNLSDIFVLANYQEMTPAVNEAMACEKPVVAMHCGGDRFVIPDDSCGLISKRLDTEDMANKIIYLIKNRNTAKAMAKNGKKRIVKEFSIEKVGERMYRAFVE